MRNAKRWTKQIVRRWLVPVAWIALLGVVYAQQTAERYIPIGESPGISGERSVMGELVAVDERSHEISVATSQGRRTVRVTDATRIWLDRSQQGRANTQGSFSDCEVGRYVEVNPSSGDSRVADWLKIRAD